MSQQNGSIAQTCSQQAMSSQPGVPSAMQQLPPWPGQSDGTEPPEHAKYVPQIPPFTQPWSQADTQMSTPQQLSARHNWPDGQSVLHVHTAPSLQN
jgi:hypothetical protein